MIRRRTVSFVGALIAGASLASCAGGIPRPDPADIAHARERWPGISAVDLDVGRDRYVMRCSGCHALHRPSEYSPRSWGELVEKMAPRAKLTAEDAEAIRRYLVTMSTATAPPAPAPRSSDR